MKAPQPFHFKHFSLQQSAGVMKVSTDSILLGSWLHSNTAENILDIGTGSGILSLLAAQKSNAAIFAIDINPAAITVAQLNFRNSVWATQLQAQHIALQDLHPAALFDVIISNPPYFENDVPSPSKNRNIARHHTTLSFEELLLHTARLLHLNGSAFFAIPAKSTLAFQTIAAQHHLFTVKQLSVISTPDKLPYLTLLQLSKIRTTPKEETLIVYTEEGKYTSAFIELTKEAYAVNYG